MGCSAPSPAAGPGFRGDAAGPWMNADAGSSPTGHSGRPWGSGCFPISLAGDSFATDLFTGNGIRWHGIPDFVFLLYNLTHSLLGIAIGYALLVAWKRSLWLPALAWPLHVLVDVPTHGDGRFITPLFWPFSEAGFTGWSWWVFPWVFYGGWIAAGVLWLLVIVLRLSWRKPT